MEDVYNNKKLENEQTIQQPTLEKLESKEKITTGDPVDTSDVLEQLKNLKDKMQNELKTDKVTANKVQDVQEEYKLENKQQDFKQGENIKEEKFEPVKQKIENLDENTQAVSQDFNEMYTKMFGTAPIIENQDDKKEEQKAVDIIKDNVSMFETEEEFKKPIYKFIGIVFKTYIILEIENEMYILDQHAAHERIMYEKVKENYYSDIAKDSQMLLLPDVVTLTHKEMDVAKENKEMFEQAGFYFEEFGENTIKLTGVPTVCIDLDTKELFLETLDEINTVARTAKQEKEEKFIATVACKAAVKANMALTREEVEKLMEQLLKLPNPFTCPHGRPTVIKMTKYDIERKFARK